MTYKLTGYLIGAAWIAWLIYWWASARNTKATARQESLGSRLSHIVPLVIGAILACKPSRHGSPIWPASDLSRAIGYVILLAGLGFSVWARRHIGANWSATVTVKESHELIRTGPYGIVRHPIYTGLLIAFLGNAVIVDEWRVLLGLAIIIAAFIRKLRIEERYMTTQFGTAYSEYKTQVPALIPGIF